MMKSMSEHGELIWCLGPNETLKPSQDYIIRDDGLSLYSMRLQLYLTLFGRRRKVRLPTRIQRLFGVSLETQLETPEDLRNASLEVCTLALGAPTKSIRVRSPSPTTNKSMTG